MAEQKKRSLAKTASWRVVATMDTILLVFLFTGDIRIAAGVGSLEVITKMILYYGHERVWNRITWGK